MLFLRKNIKKGPVYIVYVDGRYCYCGGISRTRCSRSGMQNCVGENI